MRYTNKQIQFIKDNYLDIPVKRLANMIGGSYTGVMGVLNRNGLKIPKDIAEARKKSGQFQKGGTSFNKGLKQSEFMSKEAIAKSKKTRFKKGQTPHNTKYNGHERISKDGYIEVRVSLGDYRLKHAWEWEKINGKVPDGHCLWCLDGNKLNTSPSNWELITRADNIRRNVHLQPLELMRAKKLITRIKNYGEQSKRT